MRRFAATLCALVLTLLATEQVALGCAGLIGPNGAVNLLRTTTFAGYHDGVEHYVTSFQFAGGSGQFGSLIPLPGVPTSVERGGDWTLQRLVRETSPAKLAFAASAQRAADAEVLLQVRIDALDVTILKGGGPEVGRWATEHGFRLPPDAPEMLDFYAARSPVFMAAVFDADAAKARGQQIGDGTPVHLAIPLANPWVPLRILALGKSSEARVSADVFLLTDRRPALLPVPFANGMSLAVSSPATRSLLDDLRSDKGMGWVPTDAWLSKISIDASASQLAYDLAIDAAGKSPSRVAAGLVAPSTPPTQGTPPSNELTALVTAGALAALGSLLLLATRLVFREGEGVKPLTLGLGLMTTLALAATLSFGAAGGQRPPAVVGGKVEIGIHYSRFTTEHVEVTAGAPVTFVLRNDDPIDHEWIVGDAQMHEVHRHGTEAVHGDRPNEVSLPPLTTRTTTLTFTEPGTYTFVCHFPGHEAYGMVGTLVVR